MSWLLFSIILAACFLLKTNVFFNISGANFVNNRFVAEVGSSLGAFTDSLRTAKRQYSLLALTRMGFSGQVTVRFENATKLVRTFICFHLGSLRRIKYWVRVKLWMVRFLLGHTMKVRAHAKTNKVIVVIRKM